jgi:malonate decarboxylase beta subunit
MSVDPELMTEIDLQRFLARRSFVELSARERALAVLDAGSGRELVGPFDRQHSVWLEMQDIVPQEDDGVVVMHGRIDGEPAVVIAIEGAFQGGSMGEVAGQKIVCALDLSLRDQEANLGLAVIAEIQAAIIALRRHVPVVAVIAGLVGCFGGMSLAAALCSRLIVTRQARLGMNGPEVIEQEAGIQEMEAADKRLVWSLIGGEQRAAVGLADDLVEDDADDIARTVRAAFREAKPVTHRSAQVDYFLARLAAIDPDQVKDGPTLRGLWGKGEAK